MPEAARHARRLMDPGWVEDKGQDRWPVQRLLEWAVKELTLSRRGVEMSRAGWLGGLAAEGADGEKDGGLSAEVAGT